jgi:excisionase family DNA binding protein
VSALRKEKLLDMIGVSELTGLELRTIQNAKENLGLPFHKIGRHVYFYPSEVFKWIDQRKVVKK